MGIDYLDLTFKIEKNCRLKIERKGMHGDFERAWEPHVSVKKDCFGKYTRKGDIRVGRLFEILRAHSHPVCTNCRRTLVDLPPTGACNHCHTPCPNPVLTWDQFRTQLAATLGETPENIHEDQWLFADLGFT